MISINYKEHALTWHIGDEQIVHPDMTTNEILALSLQLSKMSAQLSSLEIDALELH